MKSRTLAGVAAVGVLAIVVAVTLFFRDNGSGTAGPTSVVELRDTPGDLPKVLAAAEASIRDYWSTGLPEVYGKPFHALAGGFQPKFPSSRPWKCHGQNLTYDNIKGNAFYCGGQGRLHRLRRGVPPAPAQQDLRRPGACGRPRARDGPRDPGTSGDRESAPRSRAAT